MIAFLYLVIALFHVAHGNRTFSLLLPFSGKENTSTRITWVVFLEIRKKYKNIVSEKYLGCRIMSSWSDRQATTIN